MKISVRIATLVIATLILSTLACNAPLGVSSKLPEVIQPSDEALASFRSKWRALNLATPNGPFTLTFTEAELTAAVDAAIREAEANGADIPFEQVQVRLTEGTVNVYGTVPMQPLSFSGTITIVPTIGPSGLVEITITRTEFGPLEFESTTFEQLATAVEQSINVPIVASPFHITLSAITINDGELTISGAIAP